VFIHSPVPYSFPVSPLISRLHLNGVYGTHGGGRRRGAPRVGDSSVGWIVPLGGSDSVGSDSAGSDSAGSDSAGSDSTLSLYSRTPRVDLVDVNHNVCDTHQVCATVRHGAHRLFSLRSKSKSSSS
jgi:hypothetical protein